MENFIASYISPNSTGTDSENDEQGKRQPKYCAVNIAIIICFSIFLLW
jgi:hypothetical protein